MEAVYPLKVSNTNPQNGGQTLNIENDQQEKRCQECGEKLKENTEKEISYFTITHRDHITWKKTVYCLCRKCFQYLIEHRCPECKSENVKVRFTNDLDVIPSPELYWLKSD